MNKNIKLFLDFGIYNNNMYFPNTYIRTTEYINFLKPLINEISKTNKTELINYLENNTINIYSLSICIGIVGLNTNTFHLISNSIKNYKDLLIFLWIYTIINPIYKNKYLNILYLNNLNLVVNNISELFKIYKPSYSVRKEINKKLKEKYKIKYMIEAQEEFNNLLEKIKEYNISPNDINTEMGFTFDLELKTSIINYFIENYNIVDLIYKIDKWFIEYIPLQILHNIKTKLNNLNNINDIHALLVINNSLKHIELNTIINEQIKLLKNSSNEIKLNINYMPNMKTNMKWDGIHTYNTYVASILSIINENFNSSICLKEDIINKKNTYELYNTIINNTSFSLEKGTEIQKNAITSILFSNDYVSGYDILWDVSNENCPLYIDNKYLQIIGKNLLLLENFIRYIYFLNNKDNKNDKININKKNNMETYKEKIIDGIIDDLEESLDVVKDTMNNVKFSIKRK